MENKEFQTTLALKENITFDEKVDIEDLELCSEQTGSQNMKNIDIKEEPLDIDLIPVHERTKQTGHAFLCHEKQDFQSEIERKIEKLFGEFDMMSMHEYDLMRVKKVKQLFEIYQTNNQKEQIVDDGHLLEKCLEEKSNELTKMQQEFQKTKTVNFDLSQKIQNLEMANNQMSSENISLKAKIEEIMKEHKTIMLLNAKSMSSIVKIHENSLEDKTNEFNKIKKELYTENVELKEELSRFKENRKNITENNSSQTSEKSEMIPLQASEVSLESSEIISQNDDVSEKGANKGLRKRKSLNVDHLSTKRPNTNEKNDNIPTNSKLFCSICPHQFGSRANFNRHKVRIHGDKEKKFECNDCGNKFTTKEYLKKHINGVHGGLKFKCQQCNKELRSRQGLKIHLKTHDVIVHEGEKPFRCTECGKNFSRQFHLNEHIKKKKNHFRE
jgi:uncharacterized C2H2 Zn-finger protein